MKTFKTAFLSTFATVGIAAAFLALPATPALAQYGSDDGEDASRCLQPDRSNGNLVNTCSYTVEGMWCADGVDCNGGFYRNMATFAPRGQPGSTKSVQGMRDGKYVRWAACKGRNSITTHGTSAYSWEHICTRAY